MGRSVAVLVSYSTKNRSKVAHHVIGRHPKSEHFFAYLLEGVDRTGLVFAIFKRLEKFLECVCGGRHGLSIQRVAEKAIDIARNNGNCQCDINYRNGRQEAGISTRNGG